MTPPTRTASSCTRLPFPSDLKEEEDKNTGTTKTMTTMKRQSMHYELRVTTLASRGRHDSERQLHAIERMKEHDCDEYNTVCQTKLLLDSKLQNRNAPSAPCVTQLPSNNHQT